MDERSGDDLLSAAAANLAAWHESSIRALGLSTTTGSWWWTAATPRPWIYFTAVALHAPGSKAERREFEQELAAHLDDPLGSFQAVCESFDRFDLGQLASGPSGLVLRTTGRWFTRPAGPPPEAPATRDDDAGPATRLEITLVTSEDDLYDYECTTCAAFRAPPPIAPFEIHAPGILADPDMHVLLGRVDGALAAGAMAYVTDDLLGIYGVGTVPGQREHGYATALTRAALALAPDRPAMLQPSAEAEGMYRRLGFVEVGRFTHWG